MIPTFTYIQSINNLRSAATLFKKAGWKVIVCTLIDRGDRGANNQTYFDNWYTPYNNKLRSSYKYFADEIADLAADANLGAYGASSNTTYFVDKVHPTTAGQQLIANIVQAAINKITG